MKASIIIPAYNEEERIATVIQAALAQVYDDFEVIVVDNASTDRTAEIARTFPVTVVFEPKKGTSAARECGRQHASGDVIANVDADCIPSPDWLAKGVRYLRNPAIVAVSGPYDYYDAGFFLRLFLWSGFFLRWLVNGFVQLRWINYGGGLVGGNTIIRSDVLKKAGGYDTDVVFYGDEASIAKRIMPYGKALFAMPLYMGTSARRFKREGVLRLSYQYMTNMFGQKKEAKVPPSISLIICAYNEEKYIGECIKHVLANSHGLLSEIIVVDNASTDSTKEIASRFEGVRVVGEPSKGLTKARQKGLMEAKGEILIYIDADTELTPGWIPKMLKRYQADQSVVSVSGIYNYKDTPLFMNLVVWAYWQVAYITYLFTRYTIVGGNFAVRKKAMLDIGGFDSSIEFYGEDTDIARRLHKVGKVKFSTNMNVVTSARRLAGEGFVKSGWLYIKNFFSVAFNGRPATTEYTDYR